MQEIDRIRVAPASAAIYEHGWQSWSPSASYPLHACPLRPDTENSDRLRDFDDWGLSTTRRLLRRTPVRSFTNPSGVGRAR